MIPLIATSDFVIHQLNINKLESFYLLTMHILFYLFESINSPISDYIFFNAPCRAIIPLGVILAFLNEFGLLSREGMINLTKYNTG